ncbi:MULTISPECIES: DNA modification system-associated small protein [Xanthomonas]|uniref:DNA modification system-associated small protein n=1 Tax=Xanthomonas TaxID=338 RepID=UPI0009E9A422|nr:MULTISPECIES: DNA modification system-associated small protein [Xanthomonas]MEB1548213.1 DNA modification system-associated small protein [Xanthomonas campestris pv. campestris]MBV6882638.1 hypothetical protein [Xanthomonas campestris pv. euphorbiae]MBV7306668.1 hypothetical protein [Xanthomonas vasicola pv. vasculorum]MCC5062975.1 hypothetical protein [Xanthomonas campestris pv. raphani]MDO6936213.1 hypothetical protein [Xanthomonas vasicola]
MPRDVVTLFAQEAGKKLIRKHCRQIRLPVEDLRRLVEEVVDKSTMQRRHGLHEAFDEVLGATYEEESDDAS